VEAHRKPCSKTCHTDGGEVRERATRYITIYGRHCFADEEGVHAICEVSFEALVVGVVFVCY